MRKLLKSKKALSPVVAAIILIAVTVAVSIAVAAWMGSLTMQFMETSELTITEMTFTAGNSTVGRIVASVSNTGTSDVTVSIVKVNGDTMVTTGGADSWSAGTSATIESGGTETITIITTIAAGSKYNVNMFATDGTLVGAYTDTA
jgi:flagellin-like protein